MKNQTNTGYPYDTDNKRHYKLYRILFFIVAILLCALLCLGVNTYLDGIWQKIVIEICLSVFTGCVVWIVLDFSKSEKEREEYETTLRDKICDALAMDNSKGLLNNYSSKKVKDVLRNCIRYFNEDLADSYTEYISDNLKVLRKDFEYNVILNDKTIEQHLEYTRIFEYDNELRNEYRMQCLFILGSGTLDQSLSQDNIFFREEITNTDFIEEIKSIIKEIKAGNKQIEELINLLHLNIEINDVCRKNDINIDFSYGEDNLMLYVTLLEKDVHRTNEGYMSYKGKIKCEYPIDGDNKFYCVFSNPTLGKTSFNFCVDSKTYIITNLISMLSGCSETPKKISPNNVAFYTDNTSNIFPRSGIVIVWSKK